MTDLRSRRHAQTRADIVDAALGLFVDRGFAEVTMEEVAVAAGVSRSTVYRRFPAKEDVVLAVPRRWLEVFDRAVAEVPDTASLAEVVEAGSLAVARHIDTDHSRVRAAYAVLEAVPSLRAASLADSAWVARLVEVAEARGRRREDAVVIAGACMGGIDAMMVQWFTDGGTASVEVATRAAMRRMRPLFT